LIETQRLTLRYQLQFEIRKLFLKMNHLQNKVKVGIITILRIKNYGAELQAYALQQKLNDAGFDAEIIDYLFYKHKDHVSTRMSRGFVRVGVAKQIKELLFPIVEQIKSFPYRTAKKRRDEKFDVFHQTHTQFSKDRYCSMDDLYNAKLDYDVYVVGSDQVWNPNCNTSLEPYFLTFAPNSKRKLSYASSFGVSSVPVEAQEKYRDCLNNIECISVREKQGVNIVKQLTGRDARHVLDPTLLLEKKQWEKIAHYPELKKPYVLLYVLTDSQYTTQLAKEMASKLGYDIVRICKNAAREDKDASIHNVIDAGPSEFLGWFLNSSFVLTNSFHGTAFSVNFNRPFYSVLRANKDNNSRQQDFLDSLKLKGRILEKGNAFPLKEDYLVDYNEANRLLDEQRDKSITYLLNAIKGQDDE
jgi:hypothetical protein